MAGLATDPLDFVLYHDTQWCQGIMVPAYRCYLVVRVMNCFIRCRVSGDQGLSGRPDCLGGSVSCRSGKVMGGLLAKSDVVVWSM